jgi:aryl-alcohol dehydrogenase-like predicted oxidoreductase
VHAALDQGINFFDTADAYGKPKTASESVLGPILKPHRDKIVIATKFGRVIDDERQGASPAYVRAATEASLRRLQTDYIDLMQLHIPDPATPIEDTLGALEDLIAEGKIRAIGGSNFTGEQLAAMGKAAAANGKPPFTSTQCEYSMLYRKPVADVVAQCERQGIKLLPFRPLFNGLLTGKYRAGAAAPTDSRIGGKSDAEQARILSPANLNAVAELTAYAEGCGHTILELAIGWVLAHDIVPSVIAGVSSPRQVEGNARAADWTLTTAEKAAVDAILERCGTD